MSTVDFDLVVRDYVDVAPETTKAMEPQSTTLPMEVSRKFSEGLELMSHGEPAAAATRFEQIVEMLPDFADAHVGLGIAYAVTGKIYPALDHLEEATSLEPDNFFAHFKLGQLQFKLHVPKRGYEEMQKALDCATSIEERKLVGQLIHEQKQREEKGLARPTWDRSFSRKTLMLVGASVILPILYIFFVSAH
ncbi:MAG TPA: tetratricopeptide repeat protein [Terriglobia bacterium]|nr:tetratricopeptide repeat protein [Terriglobia bacterium]